MTVHRVTTPLKIVFQARVPHARWAPLFHVFRLEQPDVDLQWRPAGVPAPGSALLEDADVGVFVEPPCEPSLRGLTLDTSEMVLIVAAGDRLGHHDDLSVADIVDRPFAGSLDFVPESTSLWTLDEQRGGPPTLAVNDVTTAEDRLAIVAAGRGILTAPAWMAGALTHPGVITVPLRDGPRVSTRLLWRAGDGNPSVDALVDLATAWTDDGRGGWTGR